jgi:hypothetical protein
MVANNTSATNRSGGPNYGGPDRPDNNISFLPERLVGMLS